jgi:hypothetical protein
MWYFFEILVCIFFPLLLAKSASRDNEDDFKTLLIVMYGFELFLVILYYAFK